MTRKLLAPGIGGLALLVLVGAGASMFLDVDQFRPTLEHDFESATGRKVSLGKISVALKLE